MVILWFLNTFVTDEVADTTHLVDLLAAFVLVLIAASCRGERGHFGPSRV